jgi:DNA-binding beta-propeller fold protein YncE
MKNQYRKMNRLGALAVIFAVGLSMISGCSRELIVHEEISPVHMITDQSFENLDSVVLDSSGRIYVSDIYSVKVFSSQGKKISQIGKQGTAEGEFINEVIGLAINSKKELYVVDQDQNRVQVFDLEGNFLRCFGKKGTADGQFLEPQVITIDSLDLVYISDKLRNNVQVFSRGGEYLYQIGKSGAPGADFNEPESMAINRDRLYVADEENRRVQIFDLRGKHLGHLPHSGVFELDPKLEASMDDVPYHTDVENKFHRFLEGDIEGVAFDGLGLLYILNEDEGEIIVFEKEKMIGVFTSSQPILSGDGLAFDINFQYLYVVDQGNSRIQVFDVKTIHELLKL